MKELLIMLAKAMSADECINRLHESTSEYKEAVMLGNDTKNAKDGIILACHMILLNEMKGDAKDIMADMEMVDKSVNFFKTTKN